MKTRWIQTHHIHRSCKCQIAGLSVVTEFDNFCGDLDLIETLRPDVKVPILCKDFHKEVNDLKGTMDYLC